MRRTLLLAAAAFAAPATAADYRPVACQAARPYVGAALLPPPASADLIVNDALAGSFDAATQERLGRALDRFMAGTRAQAMTVAVSRPGEASWQAVRGPAGPPPQRFWWASVGKMVTAVVVLQLVDEGRLRLDDPISRFVAGVPNGDAITIAHLLEHSSGLFSANEDRRHRARPRRLSLDGELEIARRHGAMFCPGERWRYTNTGYSLLGAVIERVEAKPYAQVATARVLDRLGTTSLRMLSPDEAATDLAPLAPTNAAEPVTRPAWVGAAGSLAGRAEDMNRLLQALLGGTLLRSETVRAQFGRLYPMFDAGTYYGAGHHDLSPAWNGYLLDWA